MKTYFPKFDQSLNNFFIKYKIGNVQRTPEGKHGLISMIEANLLKVFSDSVMERSFVIFINSLLIADH